MFRYDVGGGEKMRVTFELLGGLLSFGWGLIGLDYAVGQRGSRSLDELPAYADDAPDVPSLSIVFAACNEAEKLPDALATMIAQQYPGALQIVGVNDRSDDATEAILSDAQIDAASDGDALREMIALNVRTLPSRWLGKTHAVWQGAQAATGEWILFTDADIHFGPTCLSRAVRFAHERNLDYLVAYLQLDLRTFWEKVFGLCFTYLFLMRFRPWHVRDKHLPNYLGIGAFTLVRRGAYDEIGQHRAVALEVAEDMEMGRRLKQADLRGDVVGAGEQVVVRWQGDGLWSLLTGLDKNAYAALEYNPANVISASLSLLATVVWPAIGLFVGKTRRERGWHALSALSILATSAHHCRAAGLNPLYAATLPFSVFLLIFTMFRSMWLTEKNQGITWRGTFYPLAMLRLRPIPPAPPVLAVAQPAISRR